MYSKGLLEQKKINIAPYFIILIGQTTCIAPAKMSLSTLMPEGLELGTSNCFVSCRSNIQRNSEDFPAQ